MDGSKKKLYFLKEVFHINFVSWTKCDLDNKIGKSVGETAVELNFEPC